VTTDPVWVNGTLLDADEAVVSALDHGLTLGDGLFETIRVQSSSPVFWRRHLDRLRDGLRHLGLRPPLSDVQLRAAVDETIEASGRADARVRLTVTSGSGPMGPARGEAAGTVVVAIGDLAPPPTSLRVCTVRWVRNERSALAGVKSTSYGEGVLVLEHARRTGADEAVLADTTGRLSEAVTANVFLSVDGALVTPGRAAGCLPGIVRGVLLDGGAAVERDLPLAALLRADEIFLTSATRGVVPVSHVDGHPVPSVDGPLTRSARTTFVHAVADAVASS
jgi:branched-chain amino acid aminotransferase